MEADGTSRSVYAPRPIKCRRKSGQGAEDGVIVGPESVLGVVAILELAFCCAIWATWSLKELWRVGILEVGLLSCRAAEQSLVNETAWISSF